MHKGKVDPRKFDLYRKEHQDKIRKGFMVGGKTYQCECSPLGARHKIQSYILEDNGKYEPTTVFTCLNCGNQTEVKHEPECTCVACNYITKVLTVPKTDEDTGDEPKKDSPPVPPVPKRFDPPTAPV
jgi:DNA-directed RNA polymerase subunit RPC12/RpoP